MDLVAQRLAALFVAGWMLLSFPLLGLWNHDLTLWGLPLFPLALFGIWAVLIVALAWVVESATDDAPQDAASHPSDLH